MYRTVLYDTHVNMHGEVPIRLLLQHASLLYVPFLSPLQVFIHGNGFNHNNCLNSVVHGLIIELLLILLFLFIIL